MSDELLTKLEWLSNSSYEGWDSDVIEALKEATNEIKKLREEKACWRETAEEFAEEIGDVQWASVTYAEIQKLYRKAVKRMQDGKK